MILQKKISKFIPKNRKFYAITLLVGYECGTKLFVIGQKKKFCAQRHAMREPEKKRFSVTIVVVVQKKNTNVKKKQQHPRK